MVFNYALPLYSLVDRKRVDPKSPQLTELGAQIRDFLAATIGLEALDGRVEVLAQEPYLVLNGVEESSLPKLLALADIQRTQLFRYQRDAEEAATLTPLAVVPTR